MVRITGTLVAAAGVAGEGDQAKLHGLVVAEPFRDAHVGAALVADRRAWAKSRAVRPGPG